MAVGPPPSKSPTAGNRPVVVPSILALAWSCAVCIVLVELFEPYLGPASTGLFLALGLCAAVALLPALLYGGYAGYFTDLDGHAWEIAYNPGFHLNDDGSLVLPDFGSS